MDPILDPEKTEEQFRLVESAYRKWLNDFVPSNEELACLFGSAFAFLLALDRERTGRIFLGGILGEKPTAPLA